LLLSVKRAIDGSLKALTRNYGQSIENFFYPLAAGADLLRARDLNAPWPLVVLALAAIAWFAARSWKGGGGGDPACCWPSASWACGRTR
jgi:glycine betaine/proline transport system permease protein